VESGRLTLPPVVEEEAAVATRTAGWPGQLITLDAVSPPFCQARAVQPRADVLACRAGGLTVEAVARLAELETEPLYLRAPFITVSKKAQRLPVSRQAIP
jgi:hypothetical protein